jgi:hypothetical protein
LIVAIQEFISLLNSKTAKVTEAPNFIEAAISALRGVGAEAAYMDGRHVYAVAREFDDVNWEALAKAEYLLAKKFAGAEVSFHAHQDRALDLLFPGLERLF